MFFPSVFGPMNIYMITLFPYLFIIIHVWITIALIAIKRVDEEAGAIILEII